MCIFITMILIYRGDLLNTTSQDFINNKCHPSLRVNIGLKNPMKLSGRTGFGLNMNLVVDLYAAVIDFFLHATAQFFMFKLTYILT